MDTETADRLVAAAWQFARVAEYSQGPRTYWTDGMFSWEEPYEFRNGGGSYWGTAGHGDRSVWLTVSMDESEYLKERLRVQQEHRGFLRRKCEEVLGYFGWERQLPPESPYDDCRCQVMITSVEADWSEAFTFYVNVHGSGVMSYRTESRGGAELKPAIVEFLAMVEVDPYIYDRSETRLQPVAEEASGPLKVIKWHERAFGAEQAEQLTGYLLLQIERLAAAS